MKLTETSFHEPKEVSSPKYLVQEWLRWIVDGGPVYESAEFARGFRDDAQIAAAQEYIKMLSALGLVSSGKNYALPKDILLRVAHLVQEDDEDEYLDDEDDYESDFVV